MAPAPASPVSGPGPVAALPSSPMQEDFSEEGGGRDEDQLQHEPEQQQMEEQDMEEGSGRLFENNSPHDAEPRTGTGHRDQDPAKDATLEPESDDELFINETPALDDEDDDSYQDMSTSEFPREHFDDSSNFVDEEDTTYGSPGLREAFGEGYGAGGGHLDPQQERAGSADPGRRNKRKQMKPRNIVYSLAEDTEQQRAVSAASERDRDNSPMDLSVCGRPGQAQVSQNKLYRNLFPSHYSYIITIHFRIYKYYIFAGPPAGV